jgi:hypothetical protein
MRGDHAAVRASDDLAWAKPYVDKARASVARGDVMSGEEFFKRLDAKRVALRARRGLRRSRITLRDRARNPGYAACL